MEEKIRPPFAMKVTIGWDGEVMSIIDYNVRMRLKGTLHQTLIKLKK